MAKVVIAKFARGSKSGATAVAVGRKRVRDAVSGQFLTVRTIDGQSRTFTNDLTYVFTKNVAKARRENKQVTGASDRVPEKS